MYPVPKMNSRCLKAVVQLATILIFSYVSFIDPPVRSSLSATAKSVSVDKDAVKSKSNCTEALITFLAPTREFTILMPRNVTVIKVDNEVVPSVIYQASLEGNLYRVVVSNMSDQAKLDLFTARFADKVIQEIGGRVEIGETLGQGWQGRLCNFKVGPKEQFTALIAKGNGTPFIYSLTVSEPLSSLNARRFISSLVINPDKALLAHKNDTVTSSSPTAFGTRLFSPGFLLGIILFSYLWSRLKVKSK